MERIVNLLLTKRNKKNMTNKIKEISDLVKNECHKNDRDWFYDVHLLAVEKFAIQLLKKLPKADKEIVMLGVWLHDLHRVKILKGDHQKASAKEAVKVLKLYGYNSKTIDQVKEIILTHSCYTGNMPKSLEGKILATADGMSHYVNDFFIRIAVTGQRNVEEYKEWVLEKLDRNYNNKIHFDFARKIIKKRHDVIKKFITLN